MWLELNYNIWQFANHLTVTFHSNNITVCNPILDVSSEITWDNDGNVLPSDWTLFFGLFFSVLLVPVSEPIDYEAVIVWAFFSSSNAKHSRDCYKWESKKSKECRQHQVSLVAMQQKILTAKCKDQLN